MMYLKNQGQLRLIQWKTTDLWDIKIEGVPAPFNDWFPATDITVNNQTGSTFDIPSPHISFAIPSGTNSGDLSITTIDDERDTIYNWYKDLCAKIYTPTYVLPLEDSIVKIYVVKYNSYKEPVSHIEYECVPDGNTSWSGSSTREITSLNLNFKIVRQKQL